MMLHVNERSWWVWGDRQGAHVHVGHGAGQGRTGCMHARAQKLMLKRASCPPLARRTESAQGAWASGYKPSPELPPGSRR